jgi:VWFA-related protein
MSMERVPAMHSWRQFIVGHVAQKHARSRATQLLALGAAVLLIFLLAAGAQARTQQNTPNPTNQQTPTSQQNSQIPQNAQNPPIAVKVKVINVIATARDKHGKIVPTLTKDDFVLTEDGHPQTIKYFVQQADLPLTLGLLVDTSMSQREALGDERTASATFFDHVLREDRDKAFLIHFDRQVELLQDLTSSRKKLESALDLLETPQSESSSYPSGGGGGGGGGGYGRHGGGGTLLYDAVYLASNELMKKQAGRKALIVLTDGVDHGSKETLGDAIEFAQRADTLVYSIYFPGQEGGGGRGFGGPRIGMGPMGPMGGGGGMHRRNPQEEHVDGKKVLDQMSKETGGRMFEVSKKQSVDDIYAQIEEELRNQYSLGYTPEGADADAGYHTIQLTTKQKDLAVQARTGVYVDR